MGRGINCINNELKRDVSLMDFGLSINSKRLRIARQKMLFYIIMIKRGRVNSSGFEVCDLIQGILREQLT
jgi:hypothetical protein